MLHLTTTPPTNGATDSAESTHSVVAIAVSVSLVVVLLIVIAAVLVIKIKKRLYKIDYFIPFIE